ncbi:MAG: hypothetical protein ACFBSC_09725 [Microcoleaceae cyanobacterium]
MQSSSADFQTEVLDRVFRLSPIVRFTLLSLYGALMIPLPFLAIAVNASVDPIWLGIGIAFGAIVLYGVLSERVIVNDAGIQVTYPVWIPRWLRSGWLLAWDDIKALKPRTTGQGGLVYYFLSKAGEGYLLPMRIVGFAEFVRIVQRKTGIDTTDVRPLAQPWMYLILLGFTGLLWLMDIWTVSTAINFH